MSDLPFDQEHVDKYLAEKSTKTKEPIISDKEWQKLQAECQFWDKKAVRINISDVPNNVLEFIHQLPNFTYFESQALEWKVEIIKTPIKGMDYKQ